MTRMTNTQPLAALAAGGIPRRDKQGRAFQGSQKMLFERPSKQRYAGRILDEDKLLLTAVLAPVSPQ
jgi:hypothetical protein